MRKIYTYLIYTIYLLSIVFSATAQDTTHMGTMFYVGYGHHQFMEAGTNTQEMVLYLGTGLQAANVQIYIPTGVLMSYVIPANTVITSALIPKTGTQDARLYSAPPPVGSGSTGTFANRGIRVTSNVPISVNAHIYGSASSGGTMLLPVNAWGYTYKCINSKQNYASNAFSWAYIIAKEDSTIIEITPSVITRAQNLTGLRRGQPTTIMLHKGQVYQFLGANDSADTSGNGGTSTTGKELTGTTVRALVQGKPVGVFCGSSRTSNPASCGTGGGDNDIVQSFPLHIWGKRFLTAPTSVSTSASVFSTNFYKIVVNDPTTVVRRNGAMLVPLTNSGYYEFESNTADFIEADKPVMIAQFMGGGNCNSTGTGDPDMYYITPMDAGIKKTQTMRTNKENITTNYLTLIIPTAAVPSLRIDGAAQFDYSYVHPQRPTHTVVIKKWTAAISQMTIEADSAFTGLTYGLGSVESYGFNIGAKFNPIHGVDPMFKVKWTGKTNTDWNNPSNWSTGFVPTADEHVHIAPGAINELVIGAGVEVSCQSLTIEEGGLMTVKPTGKVNVKK